MNTIQRITDRAAFVKAEAAHIDTSKTEDVSPLDVKVGDVLVGIDAQVFPFAFTVKTVQTPGGKCAFLTYEHGGMSDAIYLKHIVRRVVR